MSIFTRINTRIQKSKNSETGAMDLSSILVGVIILGLIGGVIGATTFAVIPWTQDKAAQQQLESIVNAENAYVGITAERDKDRTYGSTTELRDEQLFDNYDGSAMGRVVIYTQWSGDIAKYAAGTRSHSGQWYWVDNSNSVPRKVGPAETDPNSSIAFNFFTDSPSTAVVIE